MRLDLILSEPETIEEIAGPVADLVDLCRKTSNSSHVVLVEADSVAKAARYCSFLRILRRQCIPGLELYLYRLVVHRSKQSKRKFFEFTFKVEYGQPVPLTVENEVNAFRHDVMTGRMSQAAYTHAHWTPEFRRYLTCSYFQLSEDFFSILERTATEFEKELFGDTLFNDPFGECHDEHLHDKLALYVCSNRTRGNISAPHYFQEVFLLAESTGRRVVGYCWDMNKRNQGGPLELTWLFKGVDGRGPESVPRVVDVNYEAYDRIVPFMTPLVEQFLSNIRPGQRRFASWMSFIEDDRIRFEADLIAVMPKYCPELATTPNWNKLAMPSFERFKVPELTKVYQRFENITLMLDNVDEARINQIRGLYNSDSTDILVFVSEQLDKTRRAMFDYMFGAILPAPNADRLKQEFSIRPFLGDPRRKATVVSAFGEEFYKFQKTLSVLKQAGAYANEVLYVDVKGFVDGSITDLTLVCVGIMKGIDKAGTSDDIARSRYEQ